MANCSEPLTTEEYAAHFEAQPAKGYPRIIRHHGRKYILNVKEFSYASKLTPNNVKQMLRIEIWDVGLEKIQLMITLVKSKDCRYHSPLHPNFDIRPEYICHSTGIFLIKTMLRELRRHKFAFIVEEVYPDDVGYDWEARAACPRRLEQVMQFYARNGIKIEFDNASGKGILIIEQDNLTPSEKECRDRIISAIRAGKQAEPAPAAPFNPDYL